MNIILLFFKKKKKKKISCTQIYIGKIHRILLEVVVEWPD